MLTVSQVAFDDSAFGCWQGPKYFMESEVLSIDPQGRAGQIVLLMYQVNSNRWVTCIPLHFEGRVLLLLPSASASCVRLLSIRNLRSFADCCVCTVCVYLLAAPIPCCPRPSACPPVSCCPSRRNN